jgi:hypothetical protein
LPAKADQAETRTLQIAWPPGWELRSPVRRDAALRLEARMTSHGSTEQLLEIIAVDIRSAATPPDMDSIYGLAGGLRDAALKSASEAKTDILRLASGHGYYFVSTDRDHEHLRGNDFRQTIEGVMLVSGYLIDFNLRTDDVGSVNTEKMMAALSALAVE